jgi:hypothetical protein
MSENVGASTSRKPKDLHGLYRDIFYVSFYINGKKSESSVSSS